MKLSIKHALAIAGCLSVLIAPSALADDRLQVTGDTSISGLSGITTTDQGNGGAVVNNGFNLTVTEGTFNGNKLIHNNQAVFGGAIYQAGGTLTIKDGVSFEGNTVSSVNQTYEGWDGVDGPAGGAIYITGTTGNNVIGNVTFKNNIASAIDKATGHTESNGGAIFAQTNNSITIGNSTFEGNQSNTRGGALYNGDSVITMGQTSFTGNSTKGEGGAIYSLHSNVGVNTTTKTGDGSTFSTNNADINGGAVYNRDGKIEIGANNSFTGNTAGEKGGAIYNVSRNGNGITEVAGGTTFSGNSATNEGGAIYNSGSLTLDSEAGNITFSGNSAANGKDIYLAENSVLNIKGSNTVSIQSGEGALAGAGSITKSGSGTFEIVNSDISTSYTGTYTQESGMLSLNNSVMSDNFNIKGGGLVLRNGSKLFLSENGKIANGTITIGDSITRAAGDASVLTLKKGGQIASTVDLILNANNEIVIETGATANYGGEGGDLWAGKVTLKGGTLNYEGLETNGQLVAESGNLNVNNGTLAVSGADTSASSTIAEAVNVNIKSGSTLSIGANGNTTLDAATDKWAGTVVMTDGKLDYSMTKNGRLNASGGILNLLADSALTIENGSTIGGTTATNVTNSTLTVGPNGSITGGTNIFDNGDLIVKNNGNISGGENTFNNGSSLIVNNGGVVSGGNNNINSGSVITVNGGGTISGGTTNIANGAEGTIAAGGKVTDGTINVSGDYTNNGNIQGGTTNIKDGGTLQNNGNISGGNTNVESNGTLTVTEDGKITGGTTDVQAGGKFDNAGTVSGDAQVNISGTGTNSGTISGGTVNVNGGGSLENSGTISGGQTNIAENGSVTVTEDGKITAGSVDVEGTLTNNGTISGGDVTVSGSLNNNKEITGNTNITINNEGEIVVNNGATIDTAGQINIATGGSLTVNEGGSAEIKADDIWDGAIVNNNGTLTLVGRDDEGKDYTQTGGELVLDGSDFVLDGEINGGKVTVSNGSSFDIGENGAMNDGDLVFEGTGNTVNVAGDVEADAKYEINNGNTINVKENGNFIANNNDIWTDGTITVNGGSLDFQGTVDEQGGKANGQLIATEGEVKINSEFTLHNGSSIAAAVDTAINKDTTISAGGSLELNEGDTWASDATVTVNGGSLVYDDLTQNGHLAANSGDVTVNSGKLTVDGESYIKDEVDTTIAENATVDITGSNGNKGEVNIGRGDNWQGTITVNGGKLDYSGNQNGKLQANEGDVIIESGSNLILNDTNDVIAEAVNTTIEGTLGIQNGEVTLDNADIWTGKVNLGGNGTLNLNGVTNGTLIADGGNLNFNSGELNITGDSVIKGDTITNLINGVVNINNGTNGGGSVTLNDGDSWAANTTINLGQGGTLDYDLQSNGNLAANAGTLITQEGSQLTIKGEESFIKSDVNADLKGDLVIGDKGVVDLGNDGQTTVGANDSLTGDVTIEEGGTLNLFNDVAMKDPVAGAVDQEIAIEGTMNLETTGELHLNANLSGAGDINKNGEGNIWFHGQNESYTGTILVDNGGDLLFENGLAGNLVFGDIDGKTIGIHADEITGDLTQDREATIKYTTYHDDRDLELSGNINVSKGTLIAESKGDNNIIFDGVVNVSAADDAQNPVSMNANSNGSISFGQDVNVNKSTLNLSSVLGTTFNSNVTLTDSLLNAVSGDLNFNQLTFNDPNSIVNSMNGAINNNTIGNLDIYQGGQANFQIDVSTRDWKSDSFLISNIEDLDGGTINISDWQFIGKAPIDRDIKINVFDVNNVDPTILGRIDFTQTDKEIFTPIGWYQMFNQTRYNPATGMQETLPGQLQASLVRYNPQVFRGQVATVATYANQLVTNNIVLDHIFTVSNQLQNEKQANKYAAIYPQFAPYQYNRKDGSLWYKAYGTLEHLNMNKDLKVDNTAYGALVGADFPVIEMKKGWSFLPTAYVGYNGAHQSYDGVGMYQNGGQLGAMGTFMKNDFIGSVLAYGGGYGNQMDVAGYHDHTGNWFVGTAAKAAYNFHPTKHFTIQPTLLASYNYFHTQNWYTQFGDMNMNAGRLNGVNIAPGLNLIYGRETWSLYATLQYMFNIMGTSSGNAGNVVLPDMRMQRSYIEYGIGATKTWKDRFSAYLQITVRNIGRTGIGFQGGLNFKL